MLLNKLDNLEIKDIFKEIIECEKNDTNKKNKEKDF